MLPSPFYFVMALIFKVCLNKYVLCFLGTNSLDRSQIKHNPVSVLNKLPCPIKFTFLCQIKLFRLFVNKRTNSKTLTVFIEIARQRKCQNVVQMRCWPLEGVFKIKKHIKNFSCYLSFSNKHKNDIKQMGVSTDFQYLLAWSRRLFCKITKVRRVVSSVIPCMNSFTAQSIQV